MIRTWSAAFCMSSIRKRGWLDRKQRRAVRLTPDDYLCQLDLTWLSCNPSKGTTSWGPCIVTHEPMGGTLYILIIRIAEKIKEYLKSIKRKFHVQLLQESLLINKFSRLIYGQFQTKPHQKVFKVTKTLKFIWEYKWSCLRKSSFLLQFWKIVFLV